MALSFAAVEKAYGVMHEMGVKDIRSWPEDIMKMSDKERRELQPETTFGYDKKQDDGWENLFWLVKDPTDEYKAKFEKLAVQVPNSHISRPYRFNSELWMFGWF